MTETVARCAGMAAFDTDREAAAAGRRSAARSLLTAARQGWLMSALGYNRSRKPEAGSRKPEAGTVSAVFGSGLTPCAAPRTAGETFAG